VREAVTQVLPHAVDVASGVESSPGMKDMEQVRLFIREALS
jgi:phosphoribosylanthranilate isomerase